MKIAIDCRAFAWEGVGRYIKNLLINLFVVDFQNEYTLFFLPSDIDKFKAPNKVKIKKVAVPFPHYSFSEQVGFKRLLDKNNFDLVHFTHFARPIWWQGPNVVTIHDLTHYYFPGKKMIGLKNWYKKKAYHLALEKSVKNADRIIACSNNTKDDVVKILSSDPSKIDVVYEGVEADFKPAKKDEIGIILKKYNLDKKYIIYVGVSRVHKNIIGLIKAFSLLVNHYNRDLYLVLGGKPHRKTPETMSAIKHFGVADRVVLPGFIPDAELRAFYSGASCFVFPSFYEGFGLPLLEAMACDVPIACSNTSSLPEVAGDAALYFNPYDPADIAKTIVTILDNEALSQKLIKNGSLQVGKFSWHKMAKETLAIYEKVASI